MPSVAMNLGRGRGAKLGRHDARNPLAALSAAELNQERGSVGIEQQASEWDKLTSVLQMVPLKHRNDSNYVVTLPGTLLLRA